MEHRCEAIRLFDIPKTDKRENKSPEHAFYKIFLPNAESAGPQVARLDDQLGVQQVLGVGRGQPVVMPMGTTSYLSLSMACRTESAESSETSCSPLRPPKRIPTWSFCMTV
jgi:hypothetical protein